MFKTTATIIISKAGKEYPALRVTFPNGYVKTVFLDGAERYLVTDYVGKEEGQNDRNRNG